jgi:cytochrome c oxidase subunit 3
MSSNINIQGHPFHLVDPSPWPFTGAFGALTLTCGTVMYMHGYVGGIKILKEIVKGNGR